MSAKTQVRRVSDLHAEVRAPQCRNGLRRSANFDVCRRFAPEDIQQQLTRRAAEPCGRIARAHPNHPAGTGPLDLQPATAQPPTQIPRAAADIPPQAQCIRRPPDRARATRCGRPDRERSSPRARWERRGPVRRKGRKVPGAPVCPTTHRLYRRSLRAMPGASGPSLTNSNIGAAASPAAYTGITWKEWVTCMKSPISLGWCQSDR